MLPDGKGPADLSRLYMHYRITSVVVTAMPQAATPQAAAAPDGPSAGVGLSFFTQSQV